MLEVKFMEIISRSTKSKRVKIDHLLAILSTTTHVQVPISLVNVLTHRGETSGTLAASSLAPSVFWIDTVCVPGREFEEKGEATRSVELVYKAAEKISHP
jgi:hypothetical protein